MRGFIEPDRTPVKYKLLLLMSVGFLVIGAFIFGESMTQTIWNDIQYGSSKPSLHRRFCQ